MAGNLATLAGALIGRMRRLPSVLWRWEARFKGVEFQGACRFHGRPISLAERAHIVSGDGAKVFSATRSTTPGAFQPCVLRAVSPDAQLLLGPRVGMSSTVLCAGAVVAKDVPSGHIAVGNPARVIPPRRPA